VAKTAASSPLQAMLEKLQINPFSKAAVQAYKDQVQQKAVATQPWITRWAFNHPVFTERVENILHGSIAGIFFALTGVGVMTTSVMLFLSGLFGHWAIFGPLLILGGSLMTVGAIGYCVCHWIRMTLLVPSELYWIQTSNTSGMEIPEYGYKLLHRIRDGLWRQGHTEFMIHRLADDPFLEVIYTDTSDRQETAYFYGWDGDQELIELDGKIVAVNPLN
jgi:hypothetical protein